MKKRPRDTRRDPVEVVIHMRNGQTLTIRSTKRIIGPFVSYLREDTTLEPMNNYKAFVDTEQILAVQLVDLPLASQQAQP